jgi:hypothetical protein
MGSVETLVIIFAAAGLMAINETSMAAGRALATVADGSQT